MQMLAMLKCHRHRHWRGLVPWANRFCSLKFLFGIVWKKWNFWSRRCSREMPWANNKCNSTEKEEKDVSFHISFSVKIRKDSKFASQIDFLLDSLITNTIKCPNKTPCFFSLNPNAWHWSKVPRKWSICVSEKKNGRCFRWEEFLGFTLRKMSHFDSSFLSKMSNGVS